MCPDNPYPQQRERLFVMEEDMAYPVTRFPVVGGDKEFRKCLNIASNYCSVCRVFC